jgi:hypothetical protein
MPTTPEHQPAPGISTGQRHDSLNMGIVIPEFSSGNPQEIPDGA